MKSVLLLLVAFSFFFASTAQAEVYPSKKLVILNKDKAGGGVGVLYGKYSFTRDKAPATNAIKEIGFLTLKPGATVGMHLHENNEDAYIIISGTGLFTDADGKEHRVKAGDITIVRKGESHALANAGKVDLVFVSVIAAQQ